MKKNDTLDVYFDHQTEEKWKAKVKLIEKLKEGDTFILEDSAPHPFDNLEIPIPENDIIVHSYEEWLVKVVQSNYYNKGDTFRQKIRKVSSVGIFSSSSNSIENKEAADYPLTDKYGGAF